MSSYSYGSNATLRPKLDKDSDGRWSKSELKNYTDAYETATGTALDAEKIISSYDKDADGYLNVKEQDEVNADDALGLSALAQSDSAEAESESASTSYLEDMLEGMSSSSKAAFTVNINRYERDSTLLSAFGLASSSGNAFDLSGLLTQKREGMISAYKAKSTNTSWTGVV